MLNGKRLLITGATGSFGKQFIKTVLKEYPEVKRVVVYSRDELKQYEMGVDPAFKHPAMRFFIGDVRDAPRLAMACEGIDIVIHAAALKQVPMAEYNPMECIKTNVMGAQNVIDAAFAMGVKHVVALSTDKACVPINLYGATKLCADKLFAAANNMRGKRDIRLSVVRYGNVLGSRGSVIPFFLERRKSGVLPVTDERMTRFNITLDEGVRLVLRSLERHAGGEIFVPKIPSFRITDVAKAIAPQARIEIVGIRPGEKLHEDLIAETDSTLELPDAYVILPATQQNWSTEDYLAKHGGRRAPEGFKFNSGTNTAWLSVDEIRRQIVAHVDPAFTI
jgi:UDP-N-acetylglucosamine 4,6-dehydratase (inverting)